MELRKTAKDTWQAAPCAGPLTVTAEVYAFDLSVRAAYLDATRGYFNGAVVFLCPEGREAAPCTVEIVAPQDPVEGTWRVATTLTSDGAAPYGFGRYRASCYDELIDHPVETSAFALTSFEAAGIPHDVAIAGRQRCDLVRLGRDLERICAAQIKLFGEAPFDRYLFQVMAVGDGYGGLEHRASTSLLCSRNELPRPGAEEIDDDYLGFLGLASHEYFHAWNVKRIKPAAFTPYDLHREAYTRQLWAFEGITSYYDDLMLTRCGLIGGERYLELLARTITNVLRTPGRLVQSAAESSFDAWIKFYRQSENSANAEVSYYAKGAVIACALDLTLRAGGRTSLDHVMRALWQRYGKAETGVPEDGIQSLVNELAGQDLSEFFARFVDGTEDPPLADLFAAHGVTMHVRAARDGKDRGGKAAAGPLPACTLGVKLGAGDRLAAVFADGRRPRGRDSRPATSCWPSTASSSRPSACRRSCCTPRRGRAIAVHAFRRDELATLDVTLTAAPDEVCYLVFDAEATPAAAARRAAWLSGNA